MSSTLPADVKHGISFSAVSVCTVPLSGSLAVRVYSDTRPHNWKIASLQKGLVLVHEGEEVVGEGTGFGFPVLVYANETYFSGSARVYLSQQGDCASVRKEFIMDRVARNRFRNVRLENRKARTVLGYMAEVYQRHRRLRFLRLKSLFREMDVGTSFVETQPVGKVVITYRVGIGRVLVKVDLGLVKREGLEKMFLLNEQGSGVFRRYVDSRGTELVYGRIGAWEDVEADWACLMDVEGRFGFRLRRIPGGLLRRGREYLRGSLDWVGLDYEFGLKKTAVQYEIEILGV